MGSHIDDIGLAFESEAHDAAKAAFPLSNDLQGLALIASRLAFQTGAAWALEWNRRPTAPPASEPVVGINAWVDQQIDKAMRVTGMITAEDAAEIARGAALFVIADRETLIANLRKAGYTVAAPGEENFR